MIKSGLTEEAKFVEKELSGAVERDLRHQELVA